MSRRSGIIPEEVLIGTPEQAADYAQTIRTLRAASPKRTKQADAQFRARGLSFIHEFNKLADETTAPEELGTLDKIQADAGGAWDALTSGKPWAVGLAGAAGGGGLAALNELRKKKKDRNWWNTLWGAGIGGGLGYGGAKLMEPGGWGESFTKSVKGIDRKPPLEELTDLPAGIIPPEYFANPEKFNHITIAEILEAQNSGKPVVLTLANPPQGAVTPPGTTSLHPDKAFTTGTNWAWGLGAPLAAGTGLEAGVAGKDWLGMRLSARQSAKENTTPLINEQIRQVRRNVDQLASTEAGGSKIMGRWVNNGATSEEAAAKLRLLQQNGTENIERQLLEQSDQLGPSLGANEIDHLVQDGQITLGPGQTASNVHVPKVDVEAQQWVDDLRQLHHTDASVLSNNPQDARAGKPTTPHPAPDRFQTQAGDRFYTEDEISEIVAGQRRDAPRTARTRGLTLSTESVAAIDPIDATAASDITNRYNGLGKTNDDIRNLRQTSQELLESGEASRHLSSNRHKPGLGGPRRMPRGPDELARIKAVAMSEMSAVELQRIHTGRAGSGRAKNVQVTMKDIDGNTYTYRGSVLITKADVAAVHAGRGFDPIQRAVAGVPAEMIDVTFTYDDIRILLNEGGGNLELVDIRGNPIEIPASGSALEHKPLPIGGTGNRPTGIDLDISELYGPNSVYQVSDAVLLKKLKGMTKGQQRAYLIQLQKQHKELLEVSPGIARNLGKGLRRVAPIVGLAGLLTDIVQLGQAAGIDPKIKQP